MTTNLIQRVLQNKDFNKFKEFVKSLDNINEYIIKSEENSLNLLHFCIGYEDSEFGLKCLNHLLSMSGIDINRLAKIDGTLGISGAHLAILWKHYNALQSLINSGIDLFVCDSYGKTVSEYAVNSGDQKAIDLIDSALNRYLSSQINTSFMANKSELKSSDKSMKKLLNSSHNSEEILAKSGTKYNCSEDTESDQTIEYFNENDSIWKEIRNQSSNSCDSDNCSENTLISNISHKKTDSIKSSFSDIYDEDHNVVLIEERYEGCVDKSLSLQSLNPLDVISKGSSTQTNCDQQLDQIIRDMNRTQIFEELRAMGDSPGPVVPTTKKCYAKRLLNLRKGKNSSPSKNLLPLPDYSEELNSLIQNAFPLDEAKQLEKHFIELYENSETKRNYFNYVLLDPNITQNIPFQAISTRIAINCFTQSDIQLLLRFIKSIFYVGKGMGNRVYGHFDEALKPLNPKKYNGKVERILNIWSKDKGVVSLHCFLGITSNEALARETVIINALVLSNLTNQINGQNIRQLKWNDRKKRIFGSYLLYKSFLMYLLSGERQIRRPTIKS